MNSPALSADHEANRLASLHRLCVLDTCREEQFDKITDLIRTVLDVPIAAVSLVDADRQWFKSIHGLDVSETPRSMAFCAHTILGQVPMNIGDALSDHRFSANPLVTGEPHIRAYLGAPLRTSDGFNVGSLCAIDSRPREFGPTEEAILAKFASVVADELELRDVAQRDHLTGAHTRRAFLQAVSIEKSRSAEPGAIVTFDIDRFKGVNDRYGHPGGDAVLRAVAAEAKLALRRSDVVGRMGGEEFAILLPGCQRDAAMRNAERIRTAFEQLVFAEMPDLQVTASFGIAVLGQGSVEATMADADAALYMAKRTGRNRVVAALDLLSKAA